MDVIFMKEIAMAFIGSFGFAIIFNIQRKKLIWAALSGALGWAAYIIVFNITHSVVFSTFIGAITVGVYSEIMARIIKIPASVFSIIGIVPLVPGITAYYTVLNIVEKNNAAALNKGIETIGTAGAIAFGIMLATGTFQILQKLKKE
jgi:uncharacterized membrane protein YjjB (DUF3815 family)